ncbi:MAG TPA: helix-turn-helix domain-containing protein [Bacteroidales bacterium]|nr:helix-turn-helix domain-containing protein [Bacteroidales bacterium]
MEYVALYNKEELESIIMKCLDRHQSESQKKLDQSTTFTINQVAKKLRRHHTTIKKLVKTGRIPVTNDNRITQLALNEYLSGLQTTHK